MGSNNIRNIYSIPHDLWTQFRFDLFWLYKKYRWDTRYAIYLYFVVIITSLLSEQTHSSCSKSNNTEWYEEIDAYQTTTKQSTNIAVTS